MSVGYSFWGFLGDVKYGPGGEKLSTPDGNAFYSWSIITELLRRGKQVQLLMPNRDEHGFTYEGYDLFTAFAKYSRQHMYLELFKPCPTMMEYCIIEWRWEIPGKNTDADKGTEDYQPDLFLMREQIEFCNKNNIPFVVFDLDYKLTEEDIATYKIRNIIELGNKWSWRRDLPINAKRVQIPFDFSHIHDLGIYRNTADFEHNLVYVGNQYERDWCIDKYIPEDLEDVMIYGKWKNTEKWPDLKFGGRIQTRDMHSVYKKALLTPLLAKEEYCQQGFMTARLVEAVAYGCLPLFIEEFGNPTIRQYAGKFADELTIRNKHDVHQRVDYYATYPKERADIIEYLRNHLRFMDSKFFINDIERMLQDDKQSMCFSEKSYGGLGQVVGSTEQDG